MARSRAFALTALLVAVALLSGCTTASKNTATNPAKSAPAPVALVVKSSGQYPVNPGFDPVTLSAPTGANVTVTFTNADPAVSPIQHSWVLDGVDGAKTATLAAGASAKASFTAPAPGTYKFYCSVGDHRQRGMEGTFTVTNATG